MIELREKPPEGMLDWVKKKALWPELLIYKSGWVKDYITGLSDPCVDASCSACGQSMKLDKHGSGKNIKAAWWDGTEYREYGSYDECYCPECGKRVMAMHVSSFQDEYRRYCWPFTIERQGEAVVLYLWQVERAIDKQARVRWQVKPWEAYVYEGKKATRCKHWSTMYFGVTRYSAVWIETKKMQDTAGDAELFYCPEGIAAVTSGTALENSKLELYMNCVTAPLYPVTWLRMYQRHNRAENLMTCGLAEAVAQILHREKRETVGYDSRSGWSSSTDMLKWIDWKQKRPTEMLRIGKEEVGYFTPQKEDSGIRLRAVSCLRAKGFTLRCGEESGRPLAEQEEILRRGLKPAQVREYLDSQRREYLTLRDYWNMSEQLGNTLTEKRDLLPKDLKEAHDRCAVRQKERKLEHLKKAFGTRYRKMSMYSWEREGILIRPVETPGELIREGEQLHHCVASYAENHASGRTTIMLIRRTEKPEEPWYTLEFNQKTKSVIQNRGNRNCNRTKEVTEFEAAWLEWIRGGCVKKKETSAA